MYLTENSDDIDTPLLGAVDGVNTVFEVHFPMQMDYVTVLLNGTPIAPGVANGWRVLDAFRVQFNEPPAAVDTVAVQYATGAIKGGGANGGPDGTAVLIDASEGVPTTLASCDDGVPTTGATCVCVDCDT